MKDQYLNPLRNYFEQLSQKLFSHLKPGEDLNLLLSSELQDYIRFNDSKVRQATAVNQKDLYFTFHSNGRRVEAHFQAGSDFDTDFKVATSLIERLRLEVQVLPADPFLVEMQNKGQSENEYHGNYPSTAEIISLINDKTEGTQLTGLYAAGPQVIASRNSKGQSHWFSTDTFFMDYSLFTKNQLQENKAVKVCYAETKWNSQNFLEELGKAKNQLSLMKNKSVKLKPGKYKTYLAHDAAADIFQMLNWGALSYTSYKKGTCAFAALQDGKMSLSKKLEIQENYEMGISPQFNSMGEVSPTHLSLIKDGQLKNFLVNARTAKEYSVESNGAEHNIWYGEFLRSPEVSGGHLNEKDILKELGTGLYLGNLHYLNWSDLQTARVTGMTRYACFWVENGEIVAPIEDMRFDDTLYRILGSELIDLSEKTNLSKDIDTYYRRALGGKKIPGLLLNEFCLTL